MPQILEAFFIPHRSVVEIGEPQAQAISQRPVAHEQTGRPIGEHDAPVLLGGAQHHPFPPFVIEQREERRAVEAPILELKPARQQGSLADGAEHVPESQQASFPSGIMAVEKPLEILKARQRAWAIRYGRATDNDGYCGCADDDIFQGLSVGARKDFESGDGTELGKRGERGKIQALHSSSALACNWFDYWRGRDTTPLARAFGSRDSFCGVALEQKFSTRVGGIGPNLDVVLKTADGTLFAIESKFGEPYSRSKTKTYLKPKYFRDGRSPWTEAGLPACQGVADDLHAGCHGYRVLDVAQLLKHMLALALSGYRWALCCLWFDIPGTVADQHRKELKEFTLQIGPEAAHFSAVTYQELFDRMTHVVGEEHGEYMAYLRDRYLSGVVVSRL